MIPDQSTDGRTAQRAGLDLIRARSGGRLAATGTARWYGRDHADQLSRLQHPRDGKPNPLRDPRVRQAVAMRSTGQSWSNVISAIPASSRRLLPDSSAPPGWRVRLRSAKAEAARQAASRGQPWSWSPTAAANGPGARRLSRCRRHQDQHHLPAICRRPQRVVNNALCSWAASINDVSAI
jgi:hypothetical protein